MSGQQFLPATEVTVTLPNLDFHKEMGVLANVHHIHYIAKIEPPHAS